MKSKKRMFYVLEAAMLVVAFIFLYPILLVLINSLKS